jgi:hypothetical protein
MFLQSAIPCVPEESVLIMRLKMMKIITFHVIVFLTAGMHGLLNSLELSGLTDSSGTPGLADCRNT